MLVLPSKLNHNRYIIYKMIGKKVVFTTQERKSRKVTGIIECAVRNIFESTVDFTVRGHIFRFKEPDIITFATGKEAVLFIYGDPKAKPDVSDHALFKEIRNAYYKGETLNDTITRTAPDSVKTTTFRFIHSYIKKAHH